MENYIRSGVAEKLNEWMNIIVVFSKNQGKKK